MATGLRCLRIAAAAFVAVLLPSGLCCAAPVLPKKRALPTEVMSLAGLREVRPTVDHVAPDLRDKYDRIMKILRGGLTNAGFELSDDPDAPRVGVQIFTATDPKQPETLSLVVVTTAHQIVRLERLDMRMSVPTFSITSVQMTTPGRVDDVLESKLRGSTEFLMTLAREATARRAAENAQGAEGGE